MAQDGVHSCPRLPQYASQVFVAGVGTKQPPSAPLIVGAGPSVIRLSQDGGGFTIGQL
jgi:hypothetical protein